MIICVIQNCEAQNPEIRNNPEFFTQNLKSWSIFVCSKSYAQKMTHYMSYMTKLQTKLMDQPTLLHILLPINDVWY